MIVSFPGCHALDVTGPFEVFTNRTLQTREGQPRHDYEVILASLAGGDIQTLSGLKFADTVALRYLPKKIDTVLVAGGSDIGLDSAASTKLLQWLNAALRSVRRMCSVCTGAFLLAEAGILDGKRVTTHWDSCDRLAVKYPRVTVEPDAIFVNDAPIYTSAGVSAAIDLSLALVEADLGQPAALAVARDLVLFLRRPGGQSQFSAGLNAQAGASNRLRDLIGWMIEHPRADFSVPALANRVAMSERNFSRVFQSETSVTPARFAEAVRVDWAKAYLEKADWPLARVAERSGFGSVDSLHRGLQRHLGITPNEYRDRFSQKSRRSGR